MLVGIYASFLAVWLVILSFRVIALRGNPAFRWFSFGIITKRAYKEQSELMETLLNTRLYFL